MGSLFTSVKPARCAPDGAAWPSPDHGRACAPSPRLRSVRPGVGPGPMPRALSHIDESSADKRYAGRGLTSLLGKAQSLPLFRHQPGQAACHYGGAASSMSARWLDRLESACACSTCGRNGSDRCEIDVGWDDIACMGIGIIAGFAACAAGARACQALRYVCKLCFGELRIPTKYKIGRHSLPRAAQRSSFFQHRRADKRVRRDGRFIERIGFYNPTAKETEEGLRIVQDRLSYWVGVGAQTSPTVDRLVKQAAKKAA